MEFKQNETLRQFEQMNRMIDDFYHEIAVSLCISDSAYDILRALLLLGDGCTQTDIYRYSCLNKQTVNSSVKRLEQDGYITFEQGQGRERKIFLTAVGEKLIKEKILPIETAENEIFDEMSDMEQRMFLEITKKYMTSFQKKVGGLIDI